MVIIRNFHVLSHLLLIYICKLHRNINTETCPFCGRFLCHLDVFHRSCRVVVGLDLEYHSPFASLLLRAAGENRVQVGNFLSIYICNFYVLSYLLLIYICKLHWNLRWNYTRWRSSRGVLPSSPHTHPILTVSNPSLDSNRLNRNRRINPQVYVRSQRRRMA